MTAENTTSDKPNIPTVGLSSCEHSVISVILASASAFTSKQLPVHVKCTSTNTDNANIIIQMAKYYTQ